MQHYSNSAHASQASHIVIIRPCMTLFYIYVWVPVPNNKFAVLMFQNKKFPISILLTFTQFYVNQHFSAHSTFQYADTLILYLFCPLKHKKTPSKVGYLQQNFRNLQYCQKRPGLPRQLKTHRFFIVPIHTWSRYHAIFVENLGTLQMATCRVVIIIAI